MNAERDMIDMSVPMETLSLRIQSLRMGEQTPAVVKAIKRIGFVQLRYQGFSVRKSAEIMGVSIQTGYNWQNSWNDGGLESVFPNYAGGRESRMTDGQRADFKDAVSRGHMSTVEARDWLAEKYDLQYSIKQIHIILGNLGLRHVSVNRLPAQERTDPGRSPRMRWTERSLGLNKDC